MARMALALVFAIGLSAGPAWAAEAPDPLADRKPVVVAARLQGKRGATGVHALARAFDGPRGDGRLGAKGVVVNSGILWEKLGTRWAFS